MRYLVIDVGSMTCKYVYCTAEGDIVAQAYARHDGRPASNTPPLIPTIEGPDKGKFNEVQNYVISAEDSRLDEVSFYVDWGDGSYKMLGSISSGEEFSINHTWISEGTYGVKVKAIDQYGANRDWATLTVKMPLISQMLLERFMEWIQHFLDQFNICSYLVMI